MKVHVFNGPNTASLHLVRVLMAHESRAKCLSALREIGMKRIEVVDSPQISDAELHLALSHPRVPVWRDREEQDSEWLVGFDSLERYYLR